VGQKTGPLFKFL